MPFTSTGGIGGSKVVPFYSGGIVNNPADVIYFTTTTPATGATGVNPGTIAINQSLNTVYICSSNTGVNGAIVWQQVGVATGTVAQLTGDGATVALPSGGNINILGTAGQISVTGAGSTLTLALTNPDTFPGNLTVTGTLTVQGTGTSAWHIEHSDYRHVGKRFRRNTVSHFWSHTYNIFWKRRQYCSYQRWHRLQNRSRSSYTEH